ANNSVASIAGVASPLFFGWIYSLSVGPDALLSQPGLAFYLAGGVLALAAVLGWIVARQTQKSEALSPGT
ncbi:MAG: tetracycline resistance MFS efflux pump, partial [Caulobacteraceae bacterium]